jgi:hypothetical protein
VGPRDYRSPDRAAYVKSGGATDFDIAGRPDGRLAAVIRPRDGRYRFIWVVEPWFEPPSPWPFIAVVVAVIDRVAQSP